jgi:rhodanese-related sulfurtransferase
MKIPVAEATGGSDAWRGGGCPFGKRPLDPSSSLELVLVCRRFYPSLAAAKGGKFHGYGWMPLKVGFPLNI